MNRQIRQFVAVLLALYSILFVRLNWIQVFDADRLNSHDGNDRQTRRDFNRPRGRILASDGTTVLAQSLETPDSKYVYQRVYPQGALFGHLTGYFGLQVGSSGVERTYADELSGDATDLQIRAFINLFDSDPNVGDVVLTIDPELQKAVRQAWQDNVEGRRGSVVVLDPQSGAVKAMWSFPEYDPNLVSANDSDEGLKAKQAYLDDPANPLLARTYRETFPPGSTFKVVTAAAGLRSGLVSDDSPLFAENETYTPPSTTRPLGNSGGFVCGGNLRQMLAVSCNTGFAQMSAETLGKDPMVETAQEFGFNEAPPLDLPLAATSKFPTEFGRVLGSLPTGGTIYEDSPKLAFAGIGQGDVTATPLEMAMVAAGIGNDGVINAPHVVGSVRDAKGATVRTIKPRQWRQPLSEAQARDLRGLMVGVVTDGTASAMATEGYEVGAKTGTAQTRSGQDRSHAWMIAWAAPPGERASVAVAVIVEAQDGITEQSGARIAGPLAKRVMDKALELGG